jgi:hypothetical protein
VPVALGLAEPERRELGNRQLEWGLSLSGGGLRSGLFSVGLLKALYNSGRLDKIEVISTVSGGGYAAYWLYANHSASDQKADRFGSSSLSDANFPKRLCYLNTFSNFVTYWRILGIVPGPLNSESVRVYEDSLARSFGAGGAVEKLKMSDLKVDVKERKAPYLIMNATIISRLAKKSWPHKLFEFTPLVYGVPDISYREWSHEAAFEPSLQKVTAISGAAFAPLNQKTALVDPATGTRGVKLHDGGKSENLGAMALIRRGVRNIIISDAEHDPDYLFEAYQHLQENLKLYGLKIEVPEIDNHLKTSDVGPFKNSVSIGAVYDQAGGKRSTIYYVKANLPIKMEPLLREQQTDDSAGGKSRVAYYAALKRSSSQAKEDWQCENVKSDPLPMTAWSAHLVSRYSSLLAGDPKVRLVNGIGRLVGSRDVILKFPHYSTMDQSYYLDQANAFVGLGFLQGLDLP